MVIILFILLDKVMARDVNSAESEWAILEVTMPKNYDLKKEGGAKKQKIRTLQTIVFYFLGRFSIRLKWKKRIFSE